MGKTATKSLSEVKVKPIAKSKPDIGIDVDKSFADTLIQSIEYGKLDLSSINALTQTAQNREQSYQTIDMMSQDDVISSVLETYAEDIVQTNDKGNIVWVESDDQSVLDYTSWLLDTLNIDKHVYQWAYCLITYGDVYLRLFRKSDVDDDLLFKDNEKNRRLNEVKYAKENEEDIHKKKLNEDAKLRIYNVNDKFIPYLEMIDNPGEMFDLQKFGKTYAYIQAPVNLITSEKDSTYNYLTRYKVKKSDVEIFDAMSFVHGCIESTNQRQPESIDIFVSDVSDTEYDANGNVKNYTEKNSSMSSYKVKRGQSVLYNTFKVWRELNLLEMSAILNRLTKSSITRILSVEVGDMPKEQVQSFLSRLKEKIEQKSAILTGDNMSEYNGAAPIENTIYIPVHNQQGNVTSQTIGGDFDPKSLVDLEYFRDKLFGALKIPKQFFGFTEDGAGFNGGTSLTILSSRYGKTIKNLQNIICQMITDVVNLFLIDRNLDNYVNKFTIRMQAPVTQEELDRRANTDNRIRYVGDLMSQMEIIEDKVVKLKIYKSLISSSVNDPDVLAYIQDYIDKVEKEELDKKKQKNNESEDEKENVEEDIKIKAEDSESNLILEDNVKEEKENTDEDDSFLPSPNDLGIDLTQKYEN